MGVANCPYAHTKQICEGMIQSELVANTDMNALILRYFNPVGAHPTGLNGELSPDTPNNLIPVIMHVASGVLPQGAQSRSMERARTRISRRFMRDTSFAKTFT